MKLFRLVIVVCFLLISGKHLCAEVLRVEELELVAAFTLKMSSFTSFPEESERLRVCVLGSEELRKAFEAFEGRTIGSKKVEVIPDPKKLGQCDLLYVGEGRSQEWPLLAAKISKQATLTLSTLPNFYKAGGIVQFQKKGKRLAFSINLKQARNQSLQISSGVLKLAQDVIQ